MFFAKTFQADRAEPTRREMQFKSVTLQKACVEKSSDSPSEAFLSTGFSSSVGIHIAPHFCKCSPYHEEADRSISKQTSLGNTPEKKAQSWNNRLDLLPAPTTSAACSSQQSNVRVVEIACLFFFSISCSNIQIVMPKPPFYSSYGNRVG